MKRIGFHAGRNRSNNMLHIEADGCVVNIQVGLTDNEGRQVTRVNVLPDDDTRGGDGNGRYWYRDGARVIRLHEGELGRYITEREHGAVLWVRQSRTRLAWLLEHGLADAECDAGPLRAQLEILLSEQERALAVLADPNADERGDHE